MPDNPTLDFYNANASAYVAHARVNKRIGAFLARLPAGGRILELGAGSGLDADHMIKAGFDVDPTDGSPALAAEAERLLGRPVRPLLFEDLDAEAAYDGIYARASLLHAPRNRLPGLIARIHRALRPNGTVWASFKSGIRDGIDEGGRYYNYPDAGTLEDMWTKDIRTRDLSWAQFEIESWDGSGYFNAPTRWHAVTATR